MYVIFSPSEGFWLSNFGWSYSPEEADELCQKLFEYYSANPWQLPCIGINDIRLVKKNQFQHVGFDELVELTIDEAEILSPTMLAEFGNNIGDSEYEYLEDSLFKSSNDVSLLGFTDVLAGIKEVLDSLSRDDLSKAYQEVTSNKAYKDDCEGFYLEKVLNYSN